MRSTPTRYWRATARRVVAPDSKRHRASTVVRSRRRRPTTARSDRPQSTDAGVYIVYNLARWLSVGDLDAARQHARWIVALEQSAGLGIERLVQDALDSSAVTRLLSDVYLAAQFVVLPGALVWLYRRAPRDYRRLRNTVVATWLIAIPIFALFPVAPPRLADLGFIDTVSQQPGVGLTGRSTIFYNPLAAVPSLHVGFAAAVGLMLALALHRRWSKALALT